MNHFIIGFTNVNQNEKKIKEQNEKIEKLQQNEIKKKNGDNYSQEDIDKLVEDSEAKIILLEEVIKLRERTELVEKLEDQIITLVTILQYQLII